MTHISSEIAGETETGALSGVALMLACTVFAIFCAVVPDPRDKAVTLVFAPGTSYPEVASRLAPLDARIMRMGVTENVVTVRFFNGWHIIDLWHIGAYLPLKSGGLGDCLNSL